MCDNFIGAMSSSGGEAAVLRIFTGIFEESELSLLLSVGWFNYGEN